MPQRLPRNPFASSTTSAVAIPPTDKVSPRRPSTSKGNRLTQFFSSSPKSKEQQSAQEALLAAVAAQQQYLLNNPSPQISAPSLSLPTISLSTAKAGEANMDEPPTTLFQPPSFAEAKRQARIDAQFGPLGSQSHRYVSKHMGGALSKPVIDEPPYYYVLTTYISYLILIIFGHVRDFFGKRFRPDHYRHLKAANGYAALNSDFDNFYVRRLKLRIDDCFARPITGVPGRYVSLIDRKTDDFNKNYQFTGTYTETLNMSSYNYLGFAQSEGPCADAVEETIKKYGISATSPRADAGTSDLVLEVEERIAKFVGKPAAMVFSMGFSTNATSFPALVGKGDLIISDELNHASIRIGARLSGAMITSFKHNDMEDLERILRENISQGQPRTHRPWKKILVVVEGLYSMEGTMCDLPGLLELKKRYKYNLFVDEAHSIGALGPRGRGVCDYFGIDPAEVDILMGTLTKSFGANGGYVAAEKHIIDKLRSTNAATIYGESPTPPVLMQILSALKIIQGEINPGQGEERLQRIAFNSRYLRLGLKRLGFIVYGHDDSPIIPIVLYNPAKMPAFSHEMLRRKISVVIVGYPATPLISSRARFCVSAAHNKDDMDRLLAACDEIGNVLQLKFSTGVAGGAEHLPDGVTPEMEDEWRKANGLQGVVQAPRWTLREVIANGVQDVKQPLR
ncbi:PLP-dependent transferase [Glarea lozoyensis ATCC 20868]|uniref:PLP-dependent transferase n=1 Tax=Glarea lozoyensis (strain ATCC 20868 / MF5171) TaxID=1116229 RepID=S3CPW4_GLAL2|nr:PLP-dependent transferase [Glarea lozoyensis ATCC 20868]EPE27174.1 PLP-dependent transferase [Glarea lozoyensis ATCC 20868]